MGDKKKAGRPASYSAEYFPHYTNHDAEPHIRHIVRKWGLDGFSIYYMILEKLGSAQHHYLQYSTEEDKFDLYDQLRPADEKVIIEIIDYLITKQVLDKNLFEQGIIYSPFFVNTLSTLYSSRSRIPLIPETDNDGNITKRKVFEFSTEKYLYSTVKDMLYKENPANRTEDKTKKVNLKKINPTESTEQPPPENQPQDNSSAGAVDSVSEEEGFSSKISSVVDSVLPVCSDKKPKSKPKAVAGFKTTATGIVNPLYDQAGDMNSKSSEIGISWNKALIESPFLSLIREQLNISKDNTLSYYQKYGRDRMLNCFAEVQRQIDNPDQEVKKPSGLFISLLDKFGGTTSDDLREYIIKIEKHEDRYRK